MRHVEQESTTAWQMADQSASAKINRECEDDQRDEAQKAAVTKFCAGLNEDVMGEKWRAIVRLHVRRPVLVTDSRDGVVLHQLKPARPKRSARDRGAVIAHA